MHIRDWPSGERPREKLLARGAAVLSDAELLALFLGSGVRGLDAVATARRLLANHGPLRRLLDRPATELLKLPGLGPASSCQLAAALELASRHLAAGLERGEALTDPSAAGRYFAQRLRGHPSEIFAALFLDTRHRALAFEELFRGTVDGAEVHPRETNSREIPPLPAKRSSTETEVMSRLCSSILNSPSLAKSVVGLALKDRGGRMLRPFRLPLMMRIPGKNEVRTEDSGLRWGKVRFRK